MEQNESIVGVLTAATSGGDGLLYFFQKDADGQYLNIKFPDGYDQARQVPINTRIALCMRKDKINGFSIVCTGEKFHTVLKQL
jgi:hypothetical protein